MNHNNFKNSLFLLIAILTGLTSAAQTESPDQKNKDLPKKGQHYISKDEAIKMTTLYRQKHVSNQIQEQRGKVLPPLSEIFEGSDLLAFLSRPGVKALRVYYGMSEDLQLRLILVGVDANNIDILEGDQAIMERGNVCPPLCPPPPQSELNQ